MDDHAFEVEAVPSVLGAPSAPDVALAQPNALLGVERDSAKLIEIDGSSVGG